MATISGDVVGDGPVATVYTGLSDGVPVALKVFPKGFGKRTLAAFERERAALARLSVGSILRVDGVETLSGGRHALRMELCAQSLAGLVSRVGPLPASDVALLGQAIASGLAAAHSAGVVHGGVSPHNVLFRASGEPVLADFGVTLRHAFPRDPLHVIEFMPPEALRTSVLDERTDLYGLGAVLHFALTGRSPHPGRLGEPENERVLRVLQTPVPAIARPDVPVALSTLVGRLLAIDPAHRPVDAATVAAQLAALGPVAPAAPVAAHPSAKGPVAPAVPTAPVAAPPPFAVTPEPIVMPPLPDAGPPPPGAVVPEPIAMPSLPVAAPLAPGVPQPEVPSGVRQSFSVEQGEFDDFDLPAAAVVPVGHEEFDDFGAVTAPPFSPWSQQAGELDDFDRPPAPAPSQAPQGFVPGQVSQGVALGEAPQDFVPGQAPQGFVPSEVPQDVAPGEAPQGFASGQALQDGALGEAQQPPASGLEPSPAAASPFASGEAQQAPVSGLDPFPAAASPFASPTPPSAPWPNGVGEFDDFGSPSAAPHPAPAPFAPQPFAPPAPQAPPKAAVVFDTEGTRSRRRGVRYELVVGGALLVGLVALVGVYLTPPTVDSGAGPVVPPPSSAQDIPTATVVELELADPVDQTDKVELSWRSTATLEFGVVVAEEGKPTRTLVAHRNLTFTVPVEPGRKYCFLIRATDGNQLYESEPKSIRDAVCRK